MRKFSMLLLSLVVSSALFTQNLSAQTVTGTVTDQQSSKGVPNVSVVVKGTNTATQTDNGGAFRINAPSGGTLVFTSVGYTSQEVAVNGRTNVDVVLVPTNKPL